VNFNRDFLTHRKLEQVLLRHLPERRAVVRVKLGARAAAASTAASAKHVLRVLQRPRLVVDRALLRVAQHRVDALQGLKRTRGFFASLRVLVWVQAKGEAAVSFGDVGGSGVLGDAEHLFCFLFWRWIFGWWWWCGRFAA
jgi:hypothetical protein